MSKQFPTVQGRMARMVNLLGAGFKSRVDLSEPYLLDRARTLVGLEDFGGTEFLTPMRILLDALENEGRLNFIGRVLTQRDLLRCLTNRLRIEEYFRDYPETSEVPVPPPLVITGFPRAGTTFLHRLLAQDPESRVLRSWELFLPAPFKGRSPSVPDNRRDVVVRSSRRSAMLLLSKDGKRRLDAIHETSPDSPEECWPLLQNAFMSSVFGLGIRADSYTAYLKDSDFTGAYKYYRRQIQILTAAAPARRLVVKHPGHLGHLIDLVRVFPGARIVWCHRDPMELLASACSLAATGRTLRSDDVDLHQIGETFVTYAKSRLSRGLAARDNLGEECFLDVVYRDFTADPMATVRRIYDFLGTPLPASTASAIDDWRARNRRRRQKTRHHYNAESFGLSPGKVRPLSDLYYQRFGEQVAR